MLDHQIGPPIEVEVGGRDARAGELRQLKGLRAEEQVVLRGGGRGEQTGERGGGRRADHDRPPGGEPYQEPTARGDTHPERRCGDAVTTSRKGPPARGRAV